ncbi:MAG: flagellar biosynthesis anti-sigma factor FlgM [Ignavibacteria bacterium]|nr:MAG: flagellar biosynthesis anti-sigma factor FlgM [Ignavibacteria bacterium]
MKVNNVPNTAYVKAPKVTPKDSPKPQQTKIEDKLQISSEAKHKLNDLNNKKINEIRANIAEGKYNSDEVIDKVAEKILADFDNDGD